MRKRLEAAGFTTLASVANADLATLSKVVGDRVLATQLIAKAKALLGASAPTQPDTPPTKPAGSKSKTRRR